MTALERAIRRRDPVTGFRAQSPLDGLERQSVGFLDVFAQSVAAVAPAAAATTVGLLVAGIAPGAAVVAIVAAGILSFLVAQTISTFARRFAAAGALYTYTARGLGTRAGLAAGAAIVTGYAAIAMFALLGGAYYTTLLLTGILPGVDGPVGLSVVLALEAVPLVIVLVRGIRLSTRVALVVEALSVVLIVVLLCVLLAWIGPFDLAVLLPDPQTSPAAVAGGALIALTAYVGFESAAALGVEARSPLRTVPRAIRWTVLLAGGLYTLAAITQVAGFAAIGADFAASRSPVNALASASGLAAWAVLADVGIAASFLACAIGSTTALSRIVFAMGRDGVLPAVAGRAHPRFGTPIGAIALTTPVVVAVPFGLVASGVDLRDAMHGTISIGGIGFIVAYVLVCIAAPVFLRRIGELTVGAALTALVAATALLAALVAFATVEVLSGGWSLWIAVLIAVVAVLAIAWRVRRHPADDRIGRYDEPVAAHVLGGVAADGAP